MHFLTIQIQLYGGLVEVLEQSMFRALVRKI